MKIDFEITTKYGVYRDALHLPDDHSFTQSEIDDMKQERVNNWIAIVEAPPAEEPDASPPPASSLTIAGEEYTLLEGTPPSGAKLIEVNGHWYFKV
jgi:hypothetical protein